MAHNDKEDARARLLDRRRFIRAAGAGTAITALGGAQYLFSDELTRLARAEVRTDGRPRLPPGQRALRRLRPMGGEPGNPSPAAFHLKVGGLVERPRTFDFRALQKLGEVRLSADVHCVTGWSVLGARWTGVRLSDVAKAVGVQPGAHHVIFEAAHRYTSNVVLREALKDNTLLAYALDGRPLPRAHGAPVRAVIPDLYFWKSAKWITGIRFVARDEPGYWEQRGYHNHADPWREERYG